MARYCDHRVSATAICLAVTLTACGPSAHVTTVQNKLGELAAADGTQLTAQAPPVIILKQPFFSGDFASYEVYQKTFDIAQGLGQRGLSVVAPGDYTVHNPSAALIHGSNLVTRMHTEGISLEHALEMRVRVVSLGGSSHVAVHGDQEVIRGAKHAQPAEIRVDLRTIWTKETVMELVTTYVEDPMSDQRTEVDRLPGLREAIRITLDEVVLGFRRAFPAFHKIPSRAVLTFNPKPMFAFRYGDALPLSSQFGGMDPMDELVSKVRYYQYFKRSISMDTITDFESMEAGLSVESPGELATHGVRAGDFIVAVGPALALGIHVFVRQRRASAGRPLVLELVRGGTRHSVTIPPAPETATIRLP